MTSLTPFQERKINRVFSVLYDSDNDGYIEEKDFDIYLQKICGILNWPENGEDHSNAKATLSAVWKGLLQYADTDKDAKVSKDEWIKMWAACLKDLEQDKFPDWQQEYMNLMFAVNDKSGDEVIDKEEYETFFSKFGISNSDCEKAFNMLSGGQNITRENFAKLWKEYLTSNDTSAPGNYLFGPNI